MNAHRTTDEEINAAIGLLRDAGYAITLPEMEGETTITTLARSLGMKPSALHNRLRSPNCPPWKIVKRGPFGTVRRLRLSAEAMAYVSRPMKKGQRTDLQKAVAPRDIFAGGSRSPMGLATT